MQNEKIFKVRFADHNGKLRGNHRDFTKISFVSKNYKGEQPRCGELWDCVVVFDTMLDDPRKGVLYLRPLKRTGAASAPAAAEAAVGTAAAEAAIAAAPVRETLRLNQRISPPPRFGRRTPIVRTAWDVSTETSGGQERVRVTWTQFKGDKVVRTQSWQVNRFDHVPERWAPRVKAQVLTALARINERIKAATTAALEDSLEDALRQSVVENAGSVTTAPVAPLFDSTNTAPRIKGRLVNPVAIEVVSIEPFEHRMTRSDTSVFKDEVRLGALHWFSPMIDRGTATIVHGRRITLSNGETFEICSHTVSIVVRTVQDGRRRMIDSEAVFSSCRKLELVDRREVTWEEAEKLTVGDLVGHEFRFQWVGERLTNGKVWIPRKRPSGAAEWAKLPLPALPPQLWDDFLAGLEGKFLAELIPFQTRVRESAKVEKEEKLTVRQNALRKVVNAYMWKGGDEGCERVAIGETGNVIYHVRRPDRWPLFVLDNAGVGSFYIFDNVEDATSVANGTVTRLEARKRFRHIDHRPGWEDEVTKLLASD